MIGSLARRVLVGLLTLWAASVLVFAGTEVLPGDVASTILGQSTTPEAVEAIRKQLDLDQPAYVRYANWLGGLLQGDLGTSLVSNRPVASVIADWVGNTLLLAIVTASIVVPLALILGLVSVIRPNGFIDRSISITTLLLVSVPEFLTAALLVLVFSVAYRLLPATSNISATATASEAAVALVLPVATLVIASLAHMTRMTRAAVLDVLGSSYIEMAVLKGVPKWRIILRHALPNALGPIINVVALVLGYLVSGVVIVEAVFSYPGMGRLLLDSVGYRDLPMVQALALLFCAFYIAVNMLADFLVVLTDPRIRATRG